MKLDALTYQRHPDEDEKAQRQVRKPDGTEVSLAPRDESFGETDLPGVYEALPVHYEEEQEMKLFGRPMKRASKTTWWYAPSLGWWVKRTQQHKQDVVVDEAVFID